jgi:hypothetical protein
MCSMSSRSGVIALFPDADKRLSRVIIGRYMRNVEDIQEVP